MTASKYYDIDLDLEGKSILVTGGTGSFGKKFVKTVLERYNPHRLIIFSRDELKQFEMAQTFDPAQHRCLRYFLGDVRDAERLRMAMLLALEQTAATPAVDVKPQRVRKSRSAA